MTSVAQCLECGADIPEDAKGLCAKCLLKLGLASQLSPGFIETGVQPAPFLGFDPHDPSRRLAVEPFEFGGYRISRLLGKGGMGAVYEAEDLASGRRVALKVLGHSLDSPETRKRFIREGRLAASINHPNSVYVYGTEEIEGAPVITMELVPGGTLHERVKAGGAMPVAEAVDAILQIIAGLEAAHAVGILHRDIKPSNCFIDPSGTVKVGDFGLSISTLVARRFRADARRFDPRHAGVFVAGTIARRGTQRALGHLFRGHDALLPAHRQDGVPRGERGATSRHRARQSAAAAARNAPRKFPRRSRASSCAAWRSKQASGPRATTSCAARCCLSTPPRRRPATLGLRFVAGVVDKLVFMVAAHALPMLFFGGFEAMMIPTPCARPSGSGSSHAPFRDRLLRGGRGPVGRDSGQGARGPARRRPRSQCARHPAGAAARADLPGAGDDCVPALPRAGRSAGVDGLELRHRRYVFALSRAARRDRAAAQRLRDGHRPAHEDAGHPKIRLRVARVRRANR